MTLGDGFRHARDALEGTGTDAALDAEILVCDAAGASRTDLVAHRDRLLPKAAIERLERNLARRRAGEPMAYITGEREFWSLSIEVTPDTLVPRVETEHLVEHCLEKIAPGARLRLADLGTGAGPVALSIADERPRCDVVGCDISPAAVAVACRNARSLDLHNVRFVVSDWCRAFGEGVFDLIAGNPPYVAESDACLDAIGVSHEPRLALIAGPQGLDAIEAICAQAPGRLTAGGWLLLEHGFEQGEAVRAAFARAGFTAVRTHRDLAGLERVTEGRRDGTPGPPH